MVFYVFYHGKTATETEKTCEASFCGYTSSACALYPIPRWHDIRQRSAERPGINLYRLVSSPMMCYEYCS